MYEAYQLQVLGSCLENSSPKQWLNFKRFIIINAWISLSSCLPCCEQCGLVVLFLFQHFQNTGSRSLQELCTMRAFNGWDVWSFASDRSCMVYGFILVSGLGHVGSNYSSTHFLRFWTWSPNLSPAKIIMDPLGNTKTNLSPLPSSRTPITCPQRSKRQDGRQSKDR